MSYLEIRYRWIEVQASQGFAYRFPDKLTGSIREKYTRPAVYRWTVHTPTMSMVALYIGETENLVRRVSNCLHPGAKQLTNLRLKAYFQQAVGKGEQVQLQTLEFEPFQINKVPISLQMLGHAHLRRMLENLILVELHPTVVGSGPLILNQVFRQDEERTKRRVSNAEASLRELGLTDHQIHELLHTATIKKQGM